LSKAPFLLALEEDVHFGDAPEAAYRVGPAGSGSGPEKVFPSAMGQGVESRIPFDGNPHRSPSGKETS